MALIVAGCGADDGTSTDTGSVKPQADAGTVVTDPPDAAVTEPPPDASNNQPPDAGEPQPDAPPVKTCDGVTADVGTGNRELVPVNDGDTIFLFKGPQGGYMVYLSVRAKGIDPNDANLCYVEHVTDTNREVGRGCWKIKLTNDLGDGTHERVRVWGQIDSRYWTCPSCVRGHTLKVTTTLSDASGCGASDSWTVSVSPDAPM